MNALKLTTLIGKYSLQPLPLKITFFVCLVVFILCGIFMEKLPGYSDVYSLKKLKGSFGNVAGYKLFVNNYAGNNEVFFNRSTGKNSAIIEKDFLAEGTWYKVGVTKNGIYKVDYEFLNDLGIRPGNIDPKTLQMFGKPEGMLPQQNNALKGNPMKELAMDVQMGGDDQFNQGDYFIFYAQGPDKTGFVKDSVSDGFNLSYQKHVYADTAYFLLTWGQAEGKRIDTRSSVEGDFPLITTYDDFIFQEEEETNILNSGRNWYGTRFSGNGQASFEYKVPGIQNNSKIKFLSRVMSQSNNQARFEINISGHEVGSQDLNPVPQGNYSRKGNTAMDTFQITTSGLTDAFRVSYNFDGGGSGPGFLDFFAFSFTRNLALYDKATAFRSLESLNTTTVTYQIEASGEDPEIWDITRPQYPVQQDFSTTEGKLQFGVTSDSLREFMVFKKEEMPAPPEIKKVENQDLRNNRIPDMVIISNPAWINEAKQLADFRRQQGLAVKLVTPEMVYNSFSSGTPDITAIRDYMKFLYDQDNNKLKYLLLFGKCSFDYKNILSENTNFVPTYQSRNSLHPIFSYSSDDYYGFLEDKEGEWVETRSGDHTLDIGIGRLPVKTRAEAQTVVEKLIHYDSRERTLGSWRNNVYFLADDGDNNIHQRDANRLATLVDSTYKAFNVHKIFIDAFPQQPRAGGENAPEVNEAINEAINQGTLIFNYTGHGNESVLAAERVIDQGMINSWDNADKLPFFVTATCEFGRHDSPKRISGAEKLILKNNGGAIGLVTTARPVFSSTNEQLNRAFYYKVFNKEDGKYPALGEVFKYTKNNSLNGSVNRNFSLLGDPSMRLAYPKDSIVVDSILAFGGKNFEKILGPADTLKALNKVRLNGSVVQGGTGAPLKDFNGIVDFLVFDKPVETRTLGNDGPVFTFEQRSNIIYKGKARVIKGVFSVEIFLPKNIIYKKGRGKLSMYASRTGGNKKMEDAAGANNSIVIGGSVDNFPPDNEGPEISLYMDDFSFNPGGVTGSNTTLLAVLRDEHGINRAGGSIGQNIVVTLDGEKEITLNNFYTADTGTYKSGFIEYPLKGLEKGEHSITLRARDSYNNPGKASLKFFVGNVNSLHVNDFKVVPNPFKDKTNFFIDHNKAGQQLLVDMMIYNMQNQLVIRKQRILSQAHTVINQLHWDGRNKTGEKVKPGVYVAKVVVKSLTDGSKNAVHKRLILIN